MPDSVRTLSADDWEAAPKPAAEARYPTAQDEREATEPRSLAFVYVVIAFVFALIGAGVVAASFLE